MKLPILIEPMNGTGFRARSGAPFEASAEGVTQVEAQSRLQQMLMNRIQSGCVVSSIDLPTVPGDNPVMAVAGIFKDDPMFDDWLEAMQEYRRQVEDDPNYL